MASASKTPNLNLPQWVGTEKPERTDFNEAFAAIDDAALTVEDWTSATLKNGWVNYGGDYDIASFYKDPFGVVHFKGFIKSGSNNAVIFTLPTGYIPSKIQVLVTLSGLPRQLAQIEIFMDGNVYISNTLNNWVTLCGLSFRL